MCWDPSFSLLCFVTGTSGLQALGLDSFLWFSSLVLLVYPLKLLFYCLFILSSLPGSLPAATVAWIRDPPPNSWLQDVPCAKLSALVPPSSSGAHSCRPVGVFQTEAWRYWLLAPGLLDELFWLLRKVPHLPWGVVAIYWMLTMGVVSLVIGTFCIHICLKWSFHYPPQSSPCPRVQLGTCLPCEDTSLGSRLLHNPFSGILLHLELNCITKCIHSIRYNIIVSNFMPS